MDFCTTTTGCIRHNIPKGDIQLIDHCWNFSKEWYGNHLNALWEKWTIREARQTFMNHNLTGRIWDLEKAEERF